MTSRLARIALAVVLAGCGGHPSDDSAPEPDAIATVQVAPLAMRSLSEDLEVYGVIASGPAGRQTLSVPYESRVVHILVHAGEQLDLGAPVIEVEPSPDTQLSLAQARAASESAHATFDAVTQRFHQQLATNEEYEQAEQAARSADLQLRSLTTRGTGQPQTLLASGPAVVASVQETEGAIVPAGDPLLDLDLRNHREAQFGIEVEDVPSIAQQAVMTVSDLDVPPAITVRATVRALSDAVDPNTRLVDLYASLPTDAPFMLGQRVTGSLRVTGSPTLVVARTALLPVDDHLVLFTVEHDRAVSHVVRTGLETHDEVEVVGQGLAVGAQVVVGGVTVLSDGMHVRTSASR